MDELRKIYNEVFDGNGNVRACGRDKCAQLMQALHDRGFRNTGNRTTGVMIIPAVKNAYRNCMSAGTKNIQDATQAMSA